MNVISYGRRIAVVLTGLAVSLAGLVGMAVLAGAASAATGMLPAPASDGGAAAAVQPVVVGGMPGWQIALIAVGAALAAAVVAVLLDRARPGRRQLASETA